MNNIAASDFGTGGRNLMKLRGDTAQMNCHVSSVIYKIRDHGPAILNGEFYKEARNAELQSKASAAVFAVDALAATTSGSIPVKSRSFPMLFVIVLLSLALGSVAYYAYRQKMVVNELQADIHIYEDLYRNFE